MDHRVRPLYYTDKEGNPQMNSKTGDTHFLINHDCAVMIVDNIDGFERCCSHSSNFPMCSQCFRPIFDQSLSILLLNWDIFPSVLLEQFGMKNQYTVIILYLPTRLRARRAFPVLCYSNILAGHNTDNGQDSQIPPLSIPSQSYLSGDGMF